MVGSNHFGMCGIRGRIFHELEVVLNALVLCLRGTETLMYPSLIPVESTARSTVFPPDPPLLDACGQKRMCIWYVCTIIAADLEQIQPANQMASWARGERWNRMVPDLATAAPCIYLSLAITNKKLYILEPCPWFQSTQNKLFWSRLACMLRWRCLPPSPRSAPSSSFPRSMSLWAPSPARRDASRALWRSFQHSAAPGLYLPASSCWHPLCPEI